MSKFNADEQSIFEAIDITLEGKEYKIEKITTTMMQAAMEGVDGNTAPNDVTVLCQQLSVFIGGNPEDYQSIDVRKIGAVLKFITEKVKDSIDGIKPKNE